MRKLSREYTFEDNYEIDITGFKFLGQGCQGKVYLMPDNRVMKIFKNSEACKSEFLILKSAEKSSFFPRVYECTEYYLIREYVGGIPIKKYILDNGLSNHLALSLIKLILDFEELGFTKLDMRLGHIFVQEDETVKIIDPRNCYFSERSYPRLLLRGLRKLEVLRKFMYILKTNYPHIYQKWRRKA